MYRDFEEKTMRVMRNALLAFVPLMAVGACTTLSDQDRALLNAASQNATEAKQQAAEALSIAKQAQASAQQAAAEAKAADEKADRIFQRSLRKR
jgi:hypothetical protein